MGSEICRALAEKLNVLWKEHCDLIKETAHKPTARNIHRLRVSTRKLEAVLELSDHLVPGEPSSQTRRDIRHTREKLSHLRNVHVVLKYMKAHPQFRKKYNLEDWRQFLKLCRDRSKKQVPAALKSTHLKRQQKFIKDVTKRIESPENDGSVMRRKTEQYAHGKQMRLFNLQKKVSLSRPKTVHHIRMQAKEIRYLGEILAPFFTKNEFHISMMKGIQRTLGHVQDDRMILKNIEAYIDSQIGKKEHRGLESLKRQILANQRHSITPFEIHGNHEDLRH